MRTAFLFPGQGTDLVEVVADWRARSAHARALLDVAAECVAAPAATLALPRMLARTEVLQPVLTAVALAAHRELVEHDVRPDVVAGHSVGELAACAAAGVLAPARAVAVAARRGRLMAGEAARSAGGMVAVAASEARLHELLALGRVHGILCVAAHNAPDDWVVSGDAAALRALVASAGARPVPTPGAWHSPAMAGAHAAYLALLERELCHTPMIPILCNRDATLVTDARALPAALAGQLVRPVRWAESMATLRDAGTRRAVVCGPGKTLRRFARAVLPDAEVLVVASPDDVAAHRPAVTP